VKYTDRVERDLTDELDVTIAIKDANYIPVDSVRKTVPRSLPPTAGATRITRRTLRTVWLSGIPKIETSPSMTGPD
jgi:hypothetical protein